MAKKTSFTEVNPLENASYAELDEITRCVHFDDFKDAVREELLEPQPLRNSHKPLRRKVLWFAPSLPISKHNFYGNVSFTIKWETVLQKLGPNLYLIDQSVYKERSYTRVVLTKHNYDGVLTRVNLDADGSPMKKSWFGFHHASRCDGRVSSGPHELQIAIEADQADAKWLYSECKVAANNHSEANSHSRHHKRFDGKDTNFESFKCYKFNTARNCECPFEWTLDECEENIEKIFEANGASTSRAGMAQRTARRSEISDGAILLGVAAAATALFAAWRSYSKDSK
ncbi:uncharacterized protein LOC108665563 [Hyalella azteca]|uniref:Uncharacterized protein LOC108665563 n=1 Tax=Hyalella azteca TaxID=294128 RepID=A0A8B7N1W5_HYAAZ|nr:uncharacterized protein LOC108665563 [Hyalella azteca]